MNHPSDKKGRPRIGINAQLLSGEAGYRRAGIHQYIHQVLSHLPADGARYVIFTRQTGDWLHRDDFEVVSSVLPTERREARILWEQTIWPLEVRRRELDLLHSMAFVMPPRPRCPVVVTIYDLSFIHLPDSFPARQRRYLTSQVGRSCAAAARLVAISESGRRDIHERFAVPLDRIDVVTPGVGEDFRPPAPEALATFRRREGLPERFLLHVGTLQPRKNIPVLLRALAQIDDGDIPLVLAGGKGWMYDEIFSQVEALGLRSRVRFAGYVADDDLPLWYGAATALLFPSLYEGFGMPIVEAMACGTPVIAAATSSLPEAGGDAALYFDAPDDAALTAQIDRLLGDDDLAARMRGRGQEQARRFRWAQAGRETAAVYRRALGLVRATPQEEPATVS